MSTVIDATSMSLLGGAITLTASSGGSGTLTLGGTNPVLAGVHTLNVTNTLQVGGVGVATTTYVDSVVHGRSWLPSVRLASSANVATATGLEAGDTVDGVVLVAGYRVLLTAQTDPIENGVWVAVANGAGAASRAADLLVGANAASVAVFVQAGTYADKAFICTNNTGSAVVGTAGLVFTQFGSADVADGSITSAKILDGTIATADLADGAVTSAKIANVTIVAANLADDAVTADKLAGDAVVTANIVDGAVTGAKIAGTTITAANIFGGTITSTQLASDAVATTNIAASAVTGPKIATAFAGAGMVHNGTSLDSTHQTLDPVHCATTANITIATALVGGQSLDGLTLATGQRVLVKNQTTASQNGIYVVAATPFRANDMQTARSDQLRVGAMVFVALGTVNVGTTWRLSASGATPPTPPTIDTHTLTFAPVQITNANVSASAAIVASKIAPGTFGTGNYVVVGDMSATTFTATSDQRKKRNIKEINPDKALESICKARGVTFDWADSKAKCAGVIAQEVQDFAPELVQTDEQSFLSLNYDGLNGYLFASIKALNDRLEKLEDKSPQKRKLASSSCDCTCACKQDDSSSPAKRPNV